MFWFNYLAKAIYAALIAVSSGVVIALRNGAGAIGPYEWLIIVLGGLVAGFGVFALPPRVETPAVQRAKAAEATPATPPTPEG